MTIRPATEADARGIAETHVASWRSSYRGIVPEERLAALDAGARVEFWAANLKAMRAPKCCFVSVDDDGLVTGFVSGGPSAADNGLGTDGEIYAIYLVESAKGRGLGRGLMRAAACSLRDRGCRSVSLWLLKENPARGFYERFGGRITGEKAYETGGFTLPAIGCRWDDIEALIAALS